MVTDFDCWHEDHEHVTVDAIIKVLNSNADNARALVKSLIPDLAVRSETCLAGCQTALDYAIITQPDSRDPEMLQKLSAVAGRVL
jgi:5'-methylthioadenosine phosphorylase